MPRSRETHFQFKQKNMTNVACFQLRGYLKYHSFCLPLQLLLKELIPNEANQRTKENQDMILPVQREKLS